MTDTDETLPNGTEFERGGFHNVILSNDEKCYTLKVTFGNGESKTNTVLRKYVHQWHGDYLARGLHTRGGEATGRKSRPVRIVPY